MTTPSQLANEGAFLLEEAVIETMMKLEQDGHRPTLAELGQKLQLPQNVTTAVLQHLEADKRAKKMIRLQAPEYWIPTDGERESRNRRPDLSEIEDWAVDVNVKPTTHEGQVHIPEHPWMEAIYHHGPSVRELIENPNLQYITPVENYLRQIVDAAYRFRLQFEDNALLAHGTAHPARRLPNGDHEVDEQLTLATTTAAISFRNVRTREAVRRFLNMNDAAP